MFKLFTNNDNIDLFAAGPRKFAPVMAPTPVENTSKPEPGVISQLRGSQMELEAERLRLEAEREQLAVDQARIEEEKKRLVEIDLLLARVAAGELSFADVIAQHRSLIRKEMYFRLAELANAASSQEEKDKFIKLTDDLRETCRSTDSALYAELMSEIEKELNSEINRLKTASKSRDSELPYQYDEALKQWVSRFPTANASALPPMMLNNSMIGGPTAVVKLPSALSITFIPLMLRNPQIALADFELLKEAVFTQEVLNVSVIDYSSFLVTVRGKSVTPQETLETVRRRIQSIPGLDERLRVFALPEYRNPDQNNLQQEKFSGLSYEPIFVVMSSEAIPKPQGLVENGLLAGTLLASLATSFLFGTDVNSLNEDFMARALAGDEAIVSRVFLIVGGVLGLQAIHELGHFVAAKIHGVKLQLPFLVPSLQIGAPLSSSLFCR